MRELGTLLTAVAAMAVMAGVSSAYADQQGDGGKYKVTVVDNSDFPLWITYCKSTAESFGQAGTQCIPAHANN